ncbi:MAG: hypothetical protein P8179_18735 [Candidatus Thiodiazotropha sp.]
MSESNRIHKSGDKKRYKYNVYNLHFALYSQWGGECIREVKTHHKVWFIEWDTWDRKGDATSFNVWTQSQVGGSTTQDGPYQPNITETGRKARVFHDAGILAMTYNAIKMKYLWDGKEYELHTGVNWITLIPSVAVIIAILFFTGLWVLP